MVDRNEQPHKQGGESDSAYLEMLEKSERDLQGYHDFMVQTFVKRPYVNIVHFYNIKEQIRINAQILQEMEKDNTQLRLVADRVDCFLSRLDIRHRLVAILYFHLRTGVDRMTGIKIAKIFQRTVNKQRISAMVKTIKRLLSNDTIENGPICGLRWYDLKN